MLDTVDWKILAILQETGRVTYSQIAQQVNLTPPAVAERIRKLEAADIITGYHAAVNLERLGYPISCFVHLTVPAPVEANLIAFVQTRPEILECYLTAGQNTFVLKVATPSVSDLNTLLNELLAFGHATTFIVLSEIIVRKTIEG
ncbi:MAG: Lrp/AsnC family transcriptional regulator [Chloroflexota bacterium]